MLDMRVAAVVCRAPFGSTETNLAAMQPWIKEAHRQDVRLICFPELNICGYNPRTTTPALAQQIPGKVTDQLMHWATSYGMTILAGLVEKDHAGRMFATHLVVPPQAPIGVYRKLHIPPPEQNVFHAGDRIPVFKIPEATFGIQLCYDAHFPELATQLALKGVDIIFMPHASPRGSAEEKYQSWMRHLPARSFDNGLFVVACNQIGDNRQGLTFPGVAIVINPLGHVIAEKISQVETLLVADLKADAMQKVRDNRMRYFLPQRRGDLPKL